MGVKLLINGIAGAGKTKLLETLDPKNTLVLSRDLKGFSLNLPHFVVSEFKNVTTMLYGNKEKREQGLIQKLEKFNKAYGHHPQVVVMDAVSQIFMDIIDVAQKKPNVFGSQGVDIQREISILNKFIYEELEAKGYTVILLNHIIEERADGKFTGGYTQFGVGQFLLKGGFYSTTDEAITIEVMGNTRTIHTRNTHKISRTHTNGVLRTYPVKDCEIKNKETTTSGGVEYFNLKNYLKLLHSNKNDSSKLIL